MSLGMHQFLHLFDKIFVEVRNYLFYYFCWQSKESLVVHVTRPLLYETRSVFVSKARVEDNTERG